METTAGQYLSAFSTTSPLAVMHDAMVDMDSQMVSLSLLAYEQALGVVKNLLCFLLKIEGFCAASLELS